MTPEEIHNLQLLHRVVQAALGCHIINSTSCKLYDLDGMDASQAIFQDADLDAWQEFHLAIQDFWLAFKAEASQDSNNP